MGGISLVVMVFPAQFLDAPTEEAPSASIVQNEEDTEFEGGIYPLVVTNI